MDFDCGYRARLGWCNDCAWMVEGEEVGGYVVDLEFGVFEHGSCEGLRRSGRSGRRYLMGADAVCGGGEGEGFCFEDWFSGFVVTV